MELVILFIKKKFVAIFRHFVGEGKKKFFEKIIFFHKFPVFLWEKRTKRMSFLLFINKIITITCNMKGCLDILFSYFEYCQTFG